MFHVGQKVVCVGDFSELASEMWARELCIEFPEKGLVYCVRRVVQRPCGGDETGYAIMLDEILNMKNLLDRECEGGFIEMGSKRALPPDEIAFASVDFRPLITVEKFMTVSDRENA